MSGLGAALVDGPLVEPRAESVIVASSFEQGMVAFRHTLAFLQPAIEAEPRRFRIQDSVNRASITCRRTGAMLRCIGSDPARAHGLAPKLIILDESAQFPEGNVHRMIAALETARGKISDSRMLWLGTRPNTAVHPFEKMLEGGADFVQRHAAEKTDNPFSIRTWRKANPGLDAMPDLLAVIRREAEKAKKDADKLASFKSLRLNMGVSDTVERFVLSADVWESIERTDAEREGRYVLGIDLGANASMTAASAYWPEYGGRLEVLGLFPENPPLSERGLTDGVGDLYTRAFDRGELHLGGDEISDVPHTP